MAEKTAGASFVNAKAIQMLTKLLKDSGLTEIEYQEGSTRIRLVQGGQQTVVTTPVNVQSAQTPMVEGQQASVSQDSPDASSLGTVVKSPMVGTVYVAPEPGSAPFVQVGDTVQEGQTLLIIEAMKVMNPIRSPKAGTVSKICIQDASPVEFGEDLLCIN